MGMGAWGRGGYPDGGCVGPDQLGENDGRNEKERRGWLVPVEKNVIVWTKSGISLSHEDGHYLSGGIRSIEGGEGSTLANLTKDRKTERISNLFPNLMSMGVTIEVMLPKLTCRSGREGVIGLYASRGRYEIMTQ